MSTSRCSQSQAEAKFSAKLFLTLILVFKNIFLESFYFCKVGILGKFLFLESWYFGKVSISGKWLFLESFYFGKVGVFGKVGGYYFWKLTILGKCSRRHVYQSIEPPRGVIALVYHIVCFILVVVFS